MAIMLKTVSIVVSGKVQGVYFRQSTKEKAKQLGITGYVQNLPDKTVMVVATGTEEQLDKLTAWCRSGPAAAVVTGIKTEQKPLETFESFFIRRF